MEERGRALLQSLDIGHEESLVEFSKYVEELVNSVIEKGMKGDIARVREGLAVAEFLVEAHLKSSLDKEHSGAGRVVEVLGYIWITPFFVGGSFWAPERLPTVEENSANEPITIDSLGDGLAESAIGEPSQFVRLVRWDTRLSRYISARVLIKPDETGNRGGTEIENGEAVALRGTIDQRHVIRERP
jgi:hypothetical protein